MCTDIQFIQTIFVLLLFPAVVIAQVDLPNTFVSADGMFGINYQDGWTAVEEDGLVGVSAKQTFLQINYRDYGKEMSAQEVFDVGGSTDYGFSAPEILTVAGYSAIRARSTDQLRTILDFCDGTIALAIGFAQPGDLPSYEPIFNAIMDTIRFGTTLQSGDGGSASSVNTDAAAVCTISGLRNANLRGGSGTTFDAVGTGVTIAVDGQTTGADGFVWWRLGEGGWVRSDVVDATGSCESVAVISG